MAVCSIAPNHQVIGLVSLFPEPLRALPPKVAAERRKSMNEVSPREGLPLSMDWFGLARLHFLGFSGEQGG